MCRTDARTDILTPWAPVGAKKQTITFCVTQKQNKIFDTSGLTNWITFGDL